MSAIKGHEIQLYSEHQQQYEVQATRLLLTERSKPNSLIAHLLFGSTNKTMYYFTLQLFTTAFLVTTTIVWSLPVHRRETLPLRTTRTTFKVSQEAIGQLTRIRDDSNGLLPLWKKARSLTNETWLTEEVKSILSNAHAYSNT